MLRSHRPAVVAILCALLGGLAAAADEPVARRWNGLFQLREQFPLTSGYLILEPVSGFVLAPGDWELEVSLTQSNTFSASQVIEQELEGRTGREPMTRELFDALAATDPFEQTFYLDAEIGRLALRARRGLGRGLEIDALLPVLRVHGGNTDGLVEAFHDLLGFDQEGRKGVVRDRMDLFVSGQGLDVDLQRTSGLELGDLVLGLKKRLVGKGTAQGLAVELDLKLPTGDADLLLSSGAVDVGLSLVGSRCWRSRCLHVMAGYVVAGAGEVLPTDAQASFSSALGVEQAWSKGWGATLQAQYWQSYLDDLGFEHFAEDTIQLAVTLSRSISPRGALFLGMSENSFSFKNSSDVTLNLGWRQRLE